MRFRLNLLSTAGILFFSYVTYSVVHPLEGALRWACLAMLLTPFAVMFWLVTIIWTGDRYNMSPLARRVQHSAYPCIGFLSFIWLLTLTRDFVSLFLPRTLHTAPMSELVIALSWILFGLGFIGARHSLKVKRVEIPIKDLPESLRGFRIAQLSDTHVSSGIRAPFVRKMVKLTNSCEADVVVLTGDIADAPLKDYGRDAEPFAELRAKYAKYYVTGNHEYYWGAEPWIRKFASMGITPLINAHETIKVGDSTILFAGIPDVVAGHFKSTPPNIDQALRGALATAYPRVLLSHQTAPAPEAAAKGFQLLLSGHTHGGQFFPWTLLVSYIHEFAHGLHWLDALAIYVSRGTGYWGPPVRLGAPPEVTLLVLVAG